MPFSNEVAERLLFLCVLFYKVCLQRIAFEVTKLIHGEEETIKAQETARNLFKNKHICTENMPTETVTLGEQVHILDLLASLSIIKSKSEARRLIEQGGIEIQNEKKVNVNEILDLRNGEELLVKKGKKTFVKILVK